MLAYPEFDPIALSIPDFTLFGFTIGPINIHWYGIMYLFGFSAAWLIGMYRAKKPWTPVNAKHIEDMIFYGALGVVIGGRCGYVFFYSFGDFLDSPLSLFKVWEGGMSFHGGMLGVIIAMVLYCRKIKKNFIDIMDFAAPLVPLGLGLGRFGNFIGQELWGRATDVSWGMIFPKDPEALARHPSQLYQMFLEGFVLFAILFWFSRKPRRRGMTAALFLVFYGLFRFVVEFVREPDEHLGFVAFEWMTRGQQLSLPMILFGLAMIYWSYKNNVYAPACSQEESVEGKNAEVKSQKDTEVVAQKKSGSKKPKKQKQN